MKPLQKNMLKKLKKKPNPIFTKITLILLLTSISKTQECYSDDSDSFCLPQPPKAVKKESLFFLTPWNKVGYEHSLAHSSKLDYVSPTWFYLEKNKTNPNSMTFEGRQDIKPIWLGKIREMNPLVKILPRFYVRPDREEFKWVLKRKNREFVFSELKKLAKEYKFEGFVFDIPILNYVKYRSSVKNFLEILKKEFQGLKRFITFSGQRMDLTQSVEEIRPYVEIFDRILVCTYNYNRGWLNPLPWFKKNAEVYKKVAGEIGVPVETFMLGVQFYGFIEEKDKGMRREIKVDE